MKRMLGGLGVGLGAVLVGLMGLTQAQADTVISTTQYSYTYDNQVVCTAVRMNPATFGSLPSDPCSQATLGTYGPDRITQNVYDAAGQLLGVYQGIGTSDVRQYAYYTYTNNGLKASEMDANHNVTTFTYDGLDRLSKMQYPSTTVGSSTSSTTDYETFGYDANNNRTSWRHRNAQTVLYTYDNLNREILKDLPAYAGSTTTSKDIYTGYDGLGHILYKRFASATGLGVSYTYDGLGRVSSTTDMNNRLVSYGYNADSTRWYLQYPDGVIQGYSYNNVGALVATSTGAVGLGIAYDSLGRTTLIARSNTAQTYYAYDAVGRPTIMTHDFTGTTNDISWNFNGYNPANQITNWIASSTLYDYIEIATTAENKTYDGLNRDASIAAVSGGYDSAGNMTNDGARVFTYDVENRLLTGSGTLAGLNMEYDPEGRLYRYTYNGSQRTFLYDGTNLIGEYDSAGNMLRRYMHTLGTDQPWVQFAGASTDASNALYLYANYQGSIIAQADSTGTVARLYKYGPYGEPRNDT
ncbi:RHS repeat protein, partial [Asticcacaulis taihuensis]